MNKVSPKSLLHSKWTKVDVEKKRKHFVIISVTYDDVQKVEACVIQAVIDNFEQLLDWRDLKNTALWRSGWQ